MTPQIKPIETHYAGCRFRSRLEARWAVFFDVAGIPWRYEPQGFELSTGPYLPDFYLPECDTWIEVKGDPRRLDREQMFAAGRELPQVGPMSGCEDGPALMVLGDIPAPRESGDYGWIGINPDHPGDDASIARYGFGTYRKNRRPWYHPDESDVWLVPTVDEYEWSIPEAYQSARMARFEHGESPKVARPSRHDSSDPFGRHDGPYLLGIPNVFHAVDLDPSIDPGTGEIE